MAFCRLWDGDRHIHGAGPAAGEVEEHGFLQCRAVQSIGAVLGIDVGSAQAVHHYDHSANWRGLRAQLHIDGAAAAR